MSRECRHHQRRVVHPPGSVTSSSVEIAWSAPDTELTIIKYLVQWIEALGANAVGLGAELLRPGESIGPQAARSASQGEVDWTNAASAETDGDTPSTTLAGLDPDTKYLVRVRAVTEEINGDWSEPFEVRTLGQGGTGNQAESNVLPAPTGSKGS